MPASMTMISSRSRSTIMFMPNSPRPPRGMAVRACVVLLNKAPAPGRNRESYHREETGDSRLGLMKNKLAETACSMAVTAAEKMRDGDENHGAERGGGERIPKSSAENAEFHENPAADKGADDSKHDVGDASETAAA